MQSAHRATGGLAKVRNVDGEETIERVEVILRRREAEAPWALGTTSIALARELGTDEASLVRLLADPQVATRIHNRSGWYATAGHTASSTAEQRALFDRLVPADQPVALEPMPYEEALGEVRRSKIEGAQAAFDTLVALGEFVRVGAHLYRGAQIAAIRERLEAELRAQGRMSAARFRDLIGTSRKYAIPLLQYFDRRGITVRSGDDRTLP